MLDRIRQNAQSWGVKIAFGLIIIVFVFWGVGSMDSGSGGNAIATVNGETISLNEFARSYQIQVATVRQQMPHVSEEDLKAFGIRQQVLQTLIARTLLLQEAERMGIEVTPQEVKQSIAAIPSFHDEQGKFDAETYIRALELQGRNPGQFEREVSKDILLRKVQETVSLPATVTVDEARSVYDFSAEQRSVDYVQFAAASFLAKVTVTEEELKEAYESSKSEYEVPHRVVLDYLQITPASIASSLTVSDAEVEVYYADNAETAFSSPERATASHILVLLEEDATDEEVKKAEAKIATIQKALAGGMSFADAAKKWSEGPSASAGGSLGTFERDRMVKPFADAAFAAGIGKVTEPVRSQFGLHLIQVTKREEAGVRALDEVREEVRRQLAENKGADKVADTLDAAAELLISGKSLADIATEMQLELRTSVAFTREEAAQAVGLQGDSVDLVFNQPEGMTIDTPLAVEDGYVLATVVSSRAAYHKTLDEVRTVVESKLKQQKAMELANEAGKKALAAIASGDTGAVTSVETTAFFNRRGFVPGVGMNADLAAAVFATTDKEWLGPFESALGAVIVRLNEVKMPDEAEWESVSEQVVVQLRQAKQQELFQTFLRNLSEQAVVEIHNADMLNE